MSIYPNRIKLNLKPTQKCIDVVILENNVDFLNFLISYHCAKDQIVDAIINPSNSTIDLENVFELLTNLDIQLDNSIIKKLVLTTNDFTDDSRVLEWLNELREINPQVILEIAAEIESGENYEKTFIVSFFLGAGFVDLTKLENNLRIRCNVYYEEILNLFSERYKFDHAITNMNQFQIPQFNPDHLDLRFFLKIRIGFISDISNYEQMVDYFFSKFDLFNYYAINWMDEEFYFLLNRYPIHISPEKLKITINNCLTQSVKFILSRNIITDLKSISICDKNEKYHEMLFLLRDFNIFGLVEQMNYNLLKQEYKIEDL